jgi:hypothetical protein
MSTETIDVGLIILWFALTIWLLLIIAKPSKFYTFKKEAKWKRFKSIGTWFITTFLILTTMFIVDTTFGPKKPKAVTSNTTKVEDKKQDYEFLKPKDTNPIIMEGLESKPDVGAYDGSVYFTFVGKEPHINATFYNKTDKDQEYLWELVFDDGKTQPEYIKIPAKSSVEFDITCKHNPTMKDLTVQYDLRKIGDPKITGKLSNPAVMDPYYNEKKLREQSYVAQTPSKKPSTKSNTQNPKVRTNGNLKINEVDAGVVQVIDEYYTTDEFGFYHIKLRLRNTYYSKVSTKIELIAKDPRNGDIVSTLSYYEDIPGDSTFAKDILPLGTAYKYHDYTVIVHCDTKPEGEKPKGGIMSKIFGGLF